MIGTTTAALYKKMIGYLFDAGYVQDDFIYDSKDVIKHILGVSQSVSTQKLYISAILNLLRDAGIEIPKPYNDIMITLKNKANEKANSQELTEKQKENDMSYDDILKVYKSYAKTVDKTSVNDYKDFMILSLYILNDPVRADYNDMKIYYKAVPKDTPGNYMLYTSRKKEFVFQEYKTSNKYGKVVVNISSPLRKVIKQWLTINPNKEYLMSEEYNAAWLSLRIRIIMKRLTGKEVGINILRHSKITNMLGDQKSINEKAPIAKNMMHSTAVQEQYLVKK